LQISILSQNVKLITRRGTKATLLFAISYPNSLPATQNFDATFNSDNRIKLYECGGICCENNKPL